MRNTAADEKAFAGEMASGLKAAALRQKRRCGHKAVKKERVMERTSQKSQSGQKHIVLFISALRKGGAERVMVNLADYLHRNGVRVTLVTQYICEEEYALPAGIPRILSEITPQ